jgi:LysM repeat protein
VLSAGWRIVKKAETRMIQPNPQAQRTARRRSVQWARILWLAMASLLLWPFAAPVVAQTPGTSYGVRPGDSWTNLSARTGISIEALQAANPGAVRESGWLIVGETLVLPGPTALPPTALPPTALPEAAASQEEAAVQTYQVQAGESWNSVAQKLGVSADLLRAANPQAVRAGLVLYRDEILIVPAANPPASSPASPAAAETPAPAEEPSAEEPSAEPTANCPELWIDYPGRVEEGLTQPDGLAAMLALLRGCAVLDEENTRSGDWNGDGSPDWALVLRVDSEEAVPAESELLVVMSVGEQAELSYQARPAGQVTILAASDINLDQQPDLLWVDTTCGANSCFDTVLVRSWDGEKWVDWSQSSMVMAYAEVKLDESSAVGQGREIVLQGGEYGGSSAGPQRARTELWGSLDGAPYSLLETVYAASDCLYFKVLDANAALLQSSEAGLELARELYSQAVVSRTLRPCGQRDNELVELRSFSLFRLALVHAYSGDADQAAATVDQLKEAFADSLYLGLAEAWWSAFSASGAAESACAAATAYAEANPLTFEALSDYGYANPSVTAADLCPLLDLPEAAVEEGAVGGEPVAVRSELTPLLTLTATTALLPAPSVPGQAGELPDCPATLDGYAAALPAVLSLAEGDSLIVETWLRLCDGMTDERGGMRLADFNGDGREDALFLPTIVSDLGYGPGGAQGAVLLYHAAAEGSYTLVYSPEIYGEPRLLAVDDLNADSRVELAWSVTGCSTFCVQEIQIVGWDGKVYRPAIEPGAAIVEGSAEFVAAVSGPGQGQQLLLTGGVSGTPEGGLPIEHSEIWQSVDGGPFQRIQWTYDRGNENAGCLGLRLVEADVALQAASVTGYAPAIELYQAALAPTAEACSIYGIPASEERTLLQGLARFRLVQSLVLDGQEEGAAAVLAELEQSQPGSAYSRAAAGWLKAYDEEGDAELACAALQPLFDRETLTWQITDHFGYNHPALAPEEICFVPAVERE